MASPRTSRVPTFTALASLVVALVAVGVAVAAWLRPMPENSPPPPSAPMYSDQQISDAKANVCAAFQIVKSEVALNTHRPRPAESEETAILAIAANARLAVYAAGDYLLYRLTSEPATPADLEKPIRSLATSYLEAGIHAINDDTDADLEPFRHTIDTDIAIVDRLCQ
ncbi:hypothetical protein ACAG26_10920 [Mycobacterium sp. pUA109]|uniref:hypothetical protein n=1 Tax=Mycobacterium sp. pUA109 TaxID=3238982 RepID=UPI00351B8438